MRHILLTILSVGAALAQNQSVLTIIPQSNTNTGEVRFREQPGEGQNYVGFKAPYQIQSNLVWVLPPTDAPNTSHPTHPKEYASCLGSLGETIPQMRWFDCAMTDQINKFTKEQKIEVSDNAVGSVLALGNLTTGGMSSMVVRNSGNYNIGVFGYGNGNSAPWLKGRVGFGSILNELGSTADVAIMYRGIDRVVLQGFSTTSAALIPDAGQSVSLGLANYRWSTGYLWNLNVSAPDVDNPGKGGVDSHLIPYADNSRTLGQSGYRWREAHIKDLYPTGSVFGNLIPNVQATGGSGGTGRDLGSLDYRWHKLHVVDLDVSGDIFVGGVQGGFVTTATTQTVTGTKTFQGSIGTPLITTFASGNDTAEAVRVLGAGATKWLSLHTNAATNEGIVGFYDSSASVYKTLTFLGSLAITGQDATISHAILAPLASAPVLKVRNTAGAGFSGVEYLDDGGASRGAVGYYNSSWSNGALAGDFAVGSTSAAPWLLMYNSVPKLALGNNQVQPLTNETYDLGGSSNRFRYGYFRDIDISGSITGAGLSNYVTTNTSQTVSGSKTFSASTTFLSGTNGVAPFAVGGENATRYVFMATGFASPGGLPTNGRIGFYQNDLGSYGPLTVEGPALNLPSGNLNAGSNSVTTKHVLANSIASDIGLKITNNQSTGFSGFDLTDSSGTIKARMAWYNASAFANQNQLVFGTLASGSTILISGGSAVGLISANGLEPSGGTSLGISSNRWANTFTNYLAVTYGLVSDLNPNASDARDLGATSQRWKKLYVKDIDLSGTITGLPTGNYVTTDTTQTITAAKTFSSNTVTIATGSDATTALKASGSSSSQYFRIDLNSSAQAADLSMYDGNNSAYKTTRIVGRAELGTDDFRAPNAAHIIQTTGNGATFGTNAYVLKIRNGSSQGYSTVQFFDYTSSPTVGGISRGEIGFGNASVSNSDLQGVFFVGTTQSNAGWYLTVGSSPRMVVNNSSFTPYGGTTVNLGSSGNSWNTIFGNAYVASGNSGISTTINVRNSANTGSCSITFTGGIVTGSTC